MGLIFDMGIVEDWVFSCKDDYCHDPFSDHDWRARRTEPEARPVSHKPQRSEMLPNLFILYHLLNEFVTIIKKFVHIIK